MYTLIKGEKRHIAMEVTRISDEEFSINTCIYKILEIAGSGSTCFIDQNEKVVYFLIDTTDEDFECGEKYIAEFSVTIIGMSKIIKGRVVIHIT